MRTVVHSEVVSGALYDETDVDARVSAEVLVDALTELSLAVDRPPHPAGLVIRKTVIDGNLDLSHLALPFPVRFDGCLFTGWITLDYADLYELRLDSCAFEVDREFLSYGAIVATSLTVKHELDIRGVRGLKQLFLVASSIGTLSFGKNDVVDIKKTGYGFRTVLHGSTVGNLELDVDNASGEQPLKIPPLGTPDRLTVHSLRSLSVDSHENGVRPDLIAKWIMAGGSGDPEQTGYSRQVWESFALALEQDAMNAEATKLRILARKFGRTKMKNPFARAWDWLLERTIGYGFANHRAFVIWLVLFAVTIGATWVASAMGYLGNSGYDLSNPISIVLYALAVVLSPIGTGGPADWFFGEVPVALALGFSVMKIASLVLLGLFITGISGIVSRR